jgi:signal transduction histidine kinase
MRAAGVPPGADPPVRVEIVHESARTRVTRLFFPEHTVIRKEPLGPDVERRLWDETAVLERLRGLDGVAQLAGAPRYPGSITLADAGETSLAGAAKPLAAGELTGLAAGLARAVAAMHRRGVLHRDISPANVVVSGDGQPCLVDFALASSVAEIRPGFTHHAEIAGTLAYLAPEATGRTARPVDQRADLYELGAVLYELATGQPPFGSGDLLQLVQDHLARVPVPPTEVNPTIPVPLSQVIMHLLEKDPDNRYQTADGLLYDLELLRDAAARPGAAAVFRAGEHDLPLRLLPPSRLVGRDGEIAALEEAFEDAMSGRCRGVLVGGAPGVGKTALADQLRPVVTGADGWFVAGKFDAYRRDLEFSAVNQAFRALGRLLLAEPEDELATVRERILAAAGTNAGLLAATVPELAALLAVPPDAGDPLTVQVRLQRVGLAVLRAVASRKRPVVVFVDDLQWAGRPQLGFLDLLLSEEPVEGLLLVGAYRDEDVDPAHPLAAPLSRWRGQAGVRHLRLVGLPAPSLTAMVAEMLHVDPAAAADLAGAIEPHTSGNPYETVELLNALRREGVLTATAAGWRWDAAAARAHLSQSYVADLLAAPADLMPPRSRQLVEAMACLGGRAELSLVQAATSEPAEAVQQTLAPALDEGLLVAESGTHPAVRFRHDRIRQAVLDGLDGQRQRALHLAMARRLAAVPELFAVAAEQYLPIADGIEDPAERRQVVGLLRRAAYQATLVGDYALVTALLSAAVQLIDPGETATLAEVRTARHAALFSLGRLEEADEEYRAIEGLGSVALDRSEALVMQVLSLTHRTRLAEALGFGLESLRELGMTVPAADRLPAEVNHQFDCLYRWLDHTDAGDDLAQPEITDPALLAVSRLLNAILPAAYSAADAAMQAWLSLEPLRIWVEHGPGRTLVGPASHAAFAAVALRGDYAAGYRAARRILAVGEARGYEPGTAQARHLFAAFNCWFEPIENGVDAGQRAREGLIAEGDLANAGYAYYLTAYYLLDCAPSLDSFLTEVEAGQAFAQRTGSERTAQWLDCYRWLAGVLLGESAAAAHMPVAIDSYADQPTVLLHMHLSRAQAAAIFGDQAALGQHTAAAMPLLSTIPGLYPTAIAHLLRGLALGAEAREDDSDGRGDRLAELEELIRWLAARAADAPDNFLHLLRLLEAERAWAGGDFQAAVVAFDATRREVTQRQRPWHRALIAERAARFYLAHGADQAGYDLLAQARQEYLDWGATAKAAQLDWAHPAVRPQTGAAGPGRSAVTTGRIDLLGVLSASQALSSETSVARLRARVVQVLSAITGATGVHLLLWNEDRRDWMAPAPGADGGAVPVSGVGREHAAPMSVLRYVQRTSEPLVVADATGDDRFARDPYFADAGSCSLLALPILSRGALRAVLVLENQLIRGAFTADRLDAVKLIAAQLAVSLENAQLYAELAASRARIVAAADQTRRRMERDLHDGAQQRLLSLGLFLRAAQAAMPPEYGAQLDRAVAEVAGALDELREYARGIHPAILSDSGLGPALEALAFRSPIPVNIDVRADGRLPEQVEISAYYVVAEALTNAARHARASAVSVEVEADEAVLHVSVRDDGAGGARFAGGTGLVGLKDRVEAVGGRIHLDSPPGTGTTLSVELPLTTASRDVAPS